MGYSAVSGDLIGKTIDVEIVLKDGVYDEEGKKSKKYAINFMLKED